MQFIEEKIINGVCYELREKDSDYFYIDSSSFMIEKRSGEIKKYSVANPSHFFFCEDSGLIALLDTKGQLYIADTNSDSVTPISITNSEEGCAPVLLKDNIYWAEWGGRFLKYNLLSQKAEVMADLSEQDIMIGNLDVNEKRNELIATLFSRKESSYYLLRKSIEEEQSKLFKLPIKKQGIISGASCFEDEFLLYESKSSSVYVLKFIRDELVVLKTVSIPEKYGVLDGGICVSGNLCAMHNRNRAIIIDIDKEEIVFELSEKYISSVSFSENKLCIGCWDKGMSFLIQNY